MEMRVTGFRKGDPFSLKVVDIAPGKYMEQKAARDFKKMLKAAEKDGLALCVNSAWRSYEHQQQLWDRWFRRKRGAKPAKPGRSNHHSGIAVDINRAHDDPDGKGPIVGKTDAWLAANAATYGFVNPYSWEPWHWEYVGLAKT